MPSVHDPSFALPPRPSAVYGTGPFRIRGAAYLDDFAHYEQTLPGGLEAAVKRASDASLERFLAQRFINSQWYDIVPILYLGAAAGRVRGVSFVTQMRDNATYHAIKAVHGFSGTVLRMLSAETVALWMPRISSWFHDFGVAETRVVRPGLVRGTRTGIPRMFVQGWSALAEAFIEGVLRAKGANECRMHVLSAEPDVPVQGYETFRLTYEVSWT